MTKDLQDSAFVMAMIVVGISIGILFLVYSNREKIQADRDARSGAIAMLALGCLLCCVSISYSFSIYTSHQLTAMWDGLKARGLSDLGPFEKPIPTVFLKDMTHAHKYCGPGCGGAK